MWHNILAGSGRSHTKVRQITYYWRGLCYAQSTAPHFALAARQRSFWVAARTEVTNWNGEHFADED
jgi:hypothetical protein